MSTQDQQYISMSKYLSGAACREIAYIPFLKTQWKSDYLAVFLGIEAYLL